MRPNQVFENPPTMMPPKTEQWLRIDMTQELPVVGPPPCQVISVEKVAPEIEVEVAIELPTCIPIMENIYFEIDLPV